jgi:DNA-binding Lrp family transcriptional regulator
MLSSLQQQLLNDYQQDLPLSHTPYADIAQSLGITENEVLVMLTELMDQQFISRIGSVIAPNRLGSSALVAMRVPPDELASIAEIVNQYSEVNHNYERENRFNLWFVLVAHSVERLHAVLEEIESNTGFKPLYLPLLADYFINLGFEIDFND